MGFIIRTMLLHGTYEYPMGRILVRWHSLEIFSRFFHGPSAIGCAFHFICTVLYICKTAERKRDVSSRWVHTYLHIYFSFYTHNLGFMQDCRVSERRLFEMSAYVFIWKQYVRTCLNSDSYLRDGWVQERHVFWMCKRVFLKATCACKCKKRLISTRLQSVRETYLLDECINVFLKAIHPYGMALFSRID